MKFSVQLPVVVRVDNMGAILMTGNMMSKEVQSMWTKDINM